MRDHQKEFYYTKDSTNNKEVPDYRAQQKSQIESERDVVFKPHQLEYFYSEEETSQKMWALDKMLNQIYRFLMLVVGSCASIALYRHIKQQKEMREFARQVRLKIEKTGGTAVINSDQSVSIIMDGKVQATLFVGDKRLKSESNLVVSKEPNQHLRQVITTLVS